MFLRSLAAAGAARKAGAGWTLAGSLRENMPFILIAFAYLAAALAIFSLKNLPLIRPWAYYANAVLYLSAASVAVGLPFLYKLAVVRPDSPFALARSLAREWRLRDRSIVALPALAALVVFLPAFSAFKSSIPAFHDYNFDPLFIRMDEAIHGVDAWRLIHPVVGYGPVTFLLNGVYHCWMLLLYLGVLLVAGWVEQPKLRMQFLISFGLSWILFGTLGAILTASVGPCFYDDFYGSDRFVPLMNYLADTDRTYPLMALDVQQMLLDWANDGSNGLGSGITAMPSMHVAIASLFAIVGWHVSRLWGTLATLLCLLILIGSVHIGYHYAVDGYASILAMIALWWLAGRLVARVYRERDPSSSLSLEPATAVAE